MGIIHNTVKAALENEESPKYSRGGSRQLELEAVLEILIQMLTVKKFKGSRIFNELKSKGYKGSRTVFYTYLSKIKPTKQKFFTPYETGPAEQAQFDWSPYTVNIGDSLRLFSVQHS